MNETPKIHHASIAARFFRWLFSRRTQGRALLGLAALATLVMLFYLEENWRGRHAWQSCKRELEARGAVLDWNKFIPPPVPDDQNFFTVNTNFYLKFVKLQTEKQSNAAKQSPWLSLDYSSMPVFDSAKSKPLVVANIVVSPSSSASHEIMTNQLSATLDDPATPERVRKLLQATLGRCINGAAGFKFSEFQLSNLAPAQVSLKADTLPSIADLENLAPSNLATNLGRLRVVATSDKTAFQVWLTDVKVTAMADYLRWSDQFAPAFDEIREALKRPYAIIPGDYSQPYAMPIPNFVMMRTLAQMLAMRAQCYLFLGEPEKALRELTLIHDVCRILEKPPTGQPETLVEAMINVAISGLYVATIADGFRPNGWQEPQLAVLQKQLGQVHLPSWVVQAFESEPAATTHTLEMATGTKLADIFSLRPNERRWALWPMVKSALIPRGWIYQNMATDAKLIYQQTEGVDLTTGAIYPNKFGDLTRALGSIAWPYKFIVAPALPNFTKAWQTTAHNQTMVNEAQIVCALERFRLAHGEYPESLDALAPQFIEKVPHDIIGGQPLHYRRDLPSQSSGAAGGKFLLYSVGWNETDDGGQESPLLGANLDYSKGDWVWKN